MIRKRFAPRRFKEAPFRLIYFIDGVRVRKLEAVRAVMLHAILSHSPDCDYASAERALERSGYRDPVETGRFQASRQSVWAEEQRPKKKRFEKQKQR